MTQQRVFLDALPIAKRSLLDGCALTMLWANVLSFVETVFTKEYLLQSGEQNPRSCRWKSVTTETTITETVVLGCVSLKIQLEILQEQPGRANMFITIFCMSFLGSQHSAKQQEDFKK